MNFPQSHKHTSVRQHKHTSGRQPTIAFENLEDRRLLSVPFLGTPFIINQKIEAENFDSGGEGVAYHDTTGGNTGGALRLVENVDIGATTDTGGGFSIVDVAPGEWLAYTVNVPTGGQFFVETRVASASAGGSFHYEWNGLNVSGGIPIPNTGSTSNYLTLKTGPISLSSGTQTLRLVMNNAGTASLGSFNWIRLSPYTTATTGGGTTGGGTTGGGTTGGGTTGGGTTGGGTTGGGTTGGGTTITNGLKATYFDNMDFTGKSVTRTDANINFNWNGKSPVSLIAPTTFSVRWTGKIKAPTTGRYTFFGVADDSAKVWLNGKILLSCPSGFAPEQYSASVNLVAGQKYTLKIEYKQKTGGSQINLSWSTKSMKKQVIPTSALFTG